MPWVTVEAPRKEELSACVQCGLCLPHCPTFRLTGNEAASPRGRLTAMAAVGKDLVPLDAPFENMMWFCLQCRACEAVCPSLVPFGRAMEGARAEVAVQRPRFWRRVRHVILGRALSSRGLVGLGTFVLALLQRLRLQSVLPAPAARGLGGLRSLPLRPRTRAGEVYPAIGDVRGTAGFLAGCVMDPWFDAVNEASIELLRRCGYDVVVPASQTCCGALAAHDGAAAAARRLAARNVEAFEDVDLVVTDSAGCGAHLKQYAAWEPDGGGGLATRVRDITQVVAAGIASGRLPVLGSTSEPVVQQDPCHLRHAQRITQEPRAVLRAAGYRIEELEDDGMCCGAAGIYSLLQPGASAELAARKARLIEASGARLVSSANPGCEIQLRYVLGAGFRIAHPVELYWRRLMEDRSRGG